MLENRKCYQSSHSSTLPFQSFSSKLFKFQLPFPGPSPTVMILHNTIIILVTIMGNLLLIGAVFRSNRIKRRKRVTPVQVHQIPSFTKTSYLFVIRNDSVIKYENVNWKRRDVMRWLRFLCFI